MEKIKFRGSEKWSEIKAKEKNLKLHLIGKLQTNKVKIALKLFDLFTRSIMKNLREKFLMNKKNKT